MQKVMNPIELSDRLKNMYQKQTVLVVFGPEGGLSRNEAEALIAAGFLPICSWSAHITNRNSAIVFIISNFL